MVESGIKTSWKSNTMKYFLSVFWLAGFLGFSLQLFQRVLEYREGKLEYRELNRVLSGLQTEESGKTFDDNKEIPEAYLWKLNPDYICWLCIPGTSVNYPVARSTRPGYYLNHTFQGNVNSCGSLFVQEEGGELNKENTVIFGHNMKDGTMFADLKNYSGRDFYKSHKMIRIYYEGRWQEGIIFSCQLKEEEELQCYQTEFSNAKEKQEFIDNMKEASLYYIPVSPSVNNPIITLSTCYGRSKRMIVQAVLMCYTE